MHPVFNNQKRKVAFGFDVSTTCIGWSMMRCDADPRSYPLAKGHIDLRDIKGFWKKVAFVEKAIKELLELHQAFNVVDKLFLEEPLKKFARGKSSAATLTLLARFNSTVSYILLQLTGVEPLYIDATEARRKIGVPLISTKKASGKNQKVQTFEFLSKTVFKGEMWPTYHHRRKNVYTVKFFVYDEVDSYVILSAGLMGLGNSA